MLIMCTFIIKEDFKNLAKKIVIYLFTTLVLKKTWITYAHIAFILSSKNY